MPTSDLSFRDCPLATAAPAACAHAAKVCGLSEVDITSELSARPIRTMAPSAESHAFLRLAQTMAHAPEDVLQELANSALELCAAHSAGISLLEEEAGREFFRWRAVSGQWARYIGGTMPREASPCGTVLKRDASLLLLEPQRYYPIPPELTPAVVEVLLIPFHVGARPVGTIWVVTHDGTRHFSGDDERVIRNLGTFASSAYQALQTIEALRLSQVRYQALIHATTNSVWRMSGDGSSMLELKSPVARPHAPSAGPTRDWLRRYVPPEDRDRVAEDWAQAVRTRSFYEHEHRAIAASGEIRIWLSRAIPLLDAAGNVREWIGASVDITERKRAEDELRRTLQNLERRIAERTSELAGKNQRLEQEIRERHKAETVRMKAVANLVDAEEAERRHISRELHDQIGQQLTAMGISLRTLEPSLSPASRTVLAQLQDHLEAIGKGVHDLAHALRPSALDDAGLSAALSAYVDDWVKRTATRAEFHQRGGVSPLPSAVETTLYRLVQEALNNIAKHARATRASVLLERHADHASLIVEDDGVGFDVEGTRSTASPGHLGLLGMTERAVLCGGTLEIESAPGRGTTLYCRIPIHDENDVDAKTTDIPGR